MQINYLDEAGLQAFKDATAGVIDEFADWVQPGLIDAAKACNG